MIMIIRSIILTLLFAALSPAAELTHNFGLKAAVTRSGLSNNRAYYQGISTGYRTGVNFAVLMEINFSEHIHFLPQLEYVQKGYQLYYEGNHQANNYYEILDPDARFDYFSMPIFVKFLVPGKTISAALSLGIRAEQIIHEKRALVKTPDGTKSFYESPDLRDTNLGGSIMLGFDIMRALPVILSLEVRYNFDFGRLTPFSDDEYDLGPTRISSFDVWLGFRF